MPLDDGRATSEKRLQEKLDHALHLTRLRLERNQDIHARDWLDFAKNYADARTALTFRFRYTAPKGEQGALRFLLLHHSLRPGRLEDKAVDGDGSSAEPERLHHWRHSDIDQPIPMLVAVGDLVDTPKGIVSSGVWLLFEDEFPLTGSKFPFQVLMPPRWEWLWLPCYFVSATERKGDARESTFVDLDQRSAHFVESVPELARYFARLQTDIFAGHPIKPANYVGQPIVYLGPHGHLSVTEKIVDQCGEFVDFGVSAFDLCQ